MMWVFVAFVASVWLLFMYFACTSTVGNEEYLQHRREPSQKELAYLYKKQHAQDDDWGFS